MAFRLDSLKREYKNNSQLVCKKWFDDNYDPSVASIYFAKYKYDDMPTVGFVKKNKLNGYYQQLDNKLHSKAFGMGLCIDNELTYIWVFSNRGNPEVPQEMLNSSLYESCEWVQIESTDNKIWDYFYPGEEVDSYLYL